MEILIVLALVVNVLALVGLARVQARRRHRPYMPVDDVYQRTSGSYLVATGSGMVLTSPDGITWTER